MLVAHIIIRWLHGVCSGCFSFGPFRRCPRYRPARLRVRASERGFAVCYTLRPETASVRAVIDTLINAVGGWRYQFFGEVHEVLSPTMNDLVKLCSQWRIHLPINVIARTTVTPPEEVIE